MIGSFTNKCWSLRKAVNACSGNSPPFHSLVFRVRAVRYPLFLEKSLMWSLKKLASPTNCQICLTVFGGWNSFTAFVLSVPGSIPLSVILNPKYSVSLAPKVDLSRDNFRLYSLNLSKQLSNVRICFSWFRVWAKTSSINEIRCWRFRKTSVIK